MNTKKRIFFWASWFFAISALGQSAQTQPQFDPEAVRILKQTLSFYHSARTYQDDSLLTFRMTGGDGKETTRTFNSKLIFERPNKILYLGPSLTLTCDGRQCQIYYPDLKQYTTSKSPPVIDRAFLKSAIMEDFLTLVLKGLIDEKPFDQLAGEIDTLKYDETTEKNGKSYHRLSYTEGTDQFQVLIDARTRLFHAIAVTPQKAKSSRWSLTIECRNAALNQPVDAGVFKLAPPAGVRRVERISFTRKYDYKKLGQTFPDTPLETLGGEQKKSVKSLLGSKLTFVTFWASWCPPCREELPELQNLYAQYKSRGFQIVGINVDSEETRAEAEKFAAEMHLTFPNVWDRESKLIQGLDLSSIPAILMLDPRGKIIQVNIGISPDTGKEYQWTIEKELSSSPATQRAK